MMAARSPHVDSGVNERRLRPIYDLLDNGNNKKALQEAEKLLKKQKDFQCAKVLKALALLRLGKQDDASAVLSEVHAEAPVDDPTLQAMAICYRELHKPDLIADAYEAAVKKDPQNEEFLNHLFMAYVRLGDYKKQQLVAMNLYKLKAKNPYYFWAVMSIVMQAHTSDEKLASTMLLPLAQRMTEKFIKENKMEAEAEVQLYLMILELQGKHEEALHVLKGPLQDRISSYLHYPHQKKAELAGLLKRWPEANAAYRTLLLRNPDQWTFYKEYFQSGFSLCDENWQPDKDRLDSQVDYTPQMMVDFVLARVRNELDKSSRSLRGPFLAQIELLRQLLSRQDPIAQQLGKPLDLVLAYYEKFGDRGCFFGDIKDLLVVLQEDDRKLLLEKVCSLIKNNTQNVPVASNDKELQRHISYLQLCQHLGYHDTLSSKEKVDLALQLVDHYSNTCVLGKDLLPTDYHPNDQYSLIASHLMIKVWRETGDTNLLWQLIVLLERTLQNSPNSHQVKLLLIKVYNSVGAVSASYDLYESLDIKHVQQDSLGYFVTRHLAAKGSFTLASTVFSTTIKFFMANYKDTVDYLVSSYKFGSFTKINEFVKFRERLNNSVQYATVAVERMILDIIVEIGGHSGTEQVLNFMDIDPEKDKTAWADLRDNRDLYVMLSWDPPERQVSEADCSASFAEEIEWLKLRNLLVRSIGAAVCVSHSTDNNKLPDSNEVTNGERRSMVDVLQELLSQLKEIECSAKCSSKSKYMLVIQGPDPSRFEYYSSTSHLKVLILLFEVVLYLNALTEHGLPVPEERQPEEWMKCQVANLLKDSLSQLEKKFEDGNSPMPEAWGEVLETTSNLAETISFAAVLTGVCNRILKPVKNALTRKGKKKKDVSATSMPDTFNNFNTMVCDLEKVAQHLQRCIQKLQECCVLTNLSNLSCGDLPVTQEVQKKVEKSYQQSLKELEDLVKNKVKYFSLLRL